MKKFIKTFGALLLASLILSNCNTIFETKIPDSESSSEKLVVTELSEEFLGVYHGIQKGYFMKNQYGDEMIVAGNKIPVPSTDFKFLFKENNIVSLQHTNLEDNSRYYYDGNYKIISGDLELIKVECSLNNGKGSSPTYTLEINKTSKTGKCIGKTNEPEFQIINTRNGDYNDVSKTENDVSELKWNYSGYISNIPIKAQINHKEAYHLEGTGAIKLPFEGYYFYESKNIKIPIEGVENGVGLMNMTAFTKGGEEYFTGESVNHGESYSGTWSKGNKELRFKLFSK